MKTTRGEQLRYRARQRYARSHSARIRLGIDNGKEGNTSPADISLRRQHFRDASKQSHKSHASTLNSVGTRYSEGSFGATGGFRSRLIKKLGNRVSGPKKYGVQALTLRMRDCIENLAQMMLSEG